MPEKKTSPRKTVAAKPAVRKSVAPKTRVTAARHSRKTPPVVVDYQDAISKIAYGYWESRGFYGGSPIEDWIRAEKEFGLLN